MSALSERDRAAWSRLERRTMPSDKPATFLDLIAISPVRLHAPMRALRELIVRLHPDVHEVVRLGDRAATYGVGPRKMIDGYAYILPYQSWANLGFYRGADLKDPAELLEGTGSKMRHIKIRTVDDVKRAAVRALLVEALRERQDALSVD